MTVLIVDDHQEFRDRFMAYIARRQDLHVVGVANNGLEAVQTAIQLQPNLIFMDISLPKKNGLQAMREILLKLPRTKIVIVTIHSNHEYVNQSLRMGASGYLLKNKFLKEFDDMIASVLRGETYICPHLA